jgi:hypothetical protein
MDAQDLGEGLLGQALPLPVDAQVLADDLFRVVYLSQGTE